MLAFGLKIAWFTLSLTGLLSSLGAIPAFARSVNGYLIPVLYGVTNCMLQGLFCLGMIWKMNPLAMPRPFCIAQPTLMGVSWSLLTALTTCMTIATSVSILRPAGGMPATPSYIRRSLKWHPTCLLLLIFFPLAALVAYVVLALKFDAIKPMDGLFCDATAPVWVRLLSYAGVPLLLAIPSLLLTCAAACRLYAHSPRGTHSFAHRHLHPPSNDHFTPVPLRRQSKFRSAYSWHEAKGQDSLSGHLAPLEPVQSIGARSTTPSGTLVVEAIPSPPSSLSSASAHVVAGRVPSSPLVAKAGARYHLPFQWRPPSVPLTERSRESPDRSSRQTPSPLIFATPADEPGYSHNVTTISVSADTPEQLYEAAPWLKDEKAYLRQKEMASARKNEVHDDDDNYDAVSGSLRWIRHSDDTVSITKSELEFARSPQREDFEENIRKPSPVDPSTYDAGLSDTPIPNLTSAVWRILFFQFFSSATQILATITSLVDMFAQHDPPSAFGTQHFALLLAAWAPPIVFGFIPWRRKAF
ncbi:hypothetical protein PYCCODRAFT_1402299 [Trametes coccinea BRFM310]|uniref:Uncharacterized protein n=1 Tax=Trametes coccinea (strain BRFM310) TaxID=1353009 RepID=A0A1Y2J3W6_TRAC3|nr:hypothetical protein PYCCODRAFT_1402299 [Trametes coccinea BRFM310]